jgi:DNA-binding beta-propeller fold protein YncE
MHLPFKKSNLFILLVVITGNSLSSCKGQSEFGTNILHLVKEISLPDVKGRIDHMDINLKDQVLYIAALGNNTVEVVDLQNNKIIHSIQHLDEPQGVSYIPQHQELFVANGGSGDCYFYNTHSFEKVAAIHLSSDADDVRYDSVERKIYVGYGIGGIAIIDADSHKQIGDVKLPAHPESFQTDKKLNLLFVNVPDAHMVAVADLNQFKLINKWIRYSPAANFPMALDTTQHRLFIGYRHPSKLIVFNSKTGQEITAITMAEDADDLYYDNETAEIFVSGGDGHINIFRQQGLETYKQIANISTTNGARTSLLVPELRLFILAARASSGKPAKILIYKIDLHPNLIK